MFQETLRIGNAEKRVLVEEAKSIFEEGVNKFNLHSEPANLFDPGDIIPLWDKAYISDESGRVQVPVMVTFVYWYSDRTIENFSDSERTANSLCYRELSIKCGEHSSCGLVYSVSSPEWRQKNLSKSESDFSALRSKKKRVWRSTRAVPMPTNRWYASSARP